MNRDNTPIIDMTASGEFRDMRPKRPSLMTIAARVVAFGLLLGFAALLFWLAVFTIPVLIVLGICAYLFGRFQFARRHGSAGATTIRMWRL